MGRGCYQTRKRTKAQRIEELSLANFLGGKAIQVQKSKINFYIMKKEFSLYNIFQHLISNAVIVCCFLRIIFYLEVAVAHVVE